MATKRYNYEPESRSYSYSGKRVTETEYRDIQKQVAKLDEIAQRLEILNKLPPNEYAKHFNEANILCYKKQSCEYWIEYILSHSKYSCRNIEKRK